MAWKTSISSSVYVERVTMDCSSRDRAKECSLCLSTPVIMARWTSLHLERRQLILCVLSSCLSYPP